MLLRKDDTAKLPFGREHGSVSQSPIVAEGQVDDVRQRYRLNSVPESDHRARSPGGRKPDISAKTERVQATRTKACSLRSALPESGCPGSSPDSATDRTRAQTRRRLPAQTACLRRLADRKSNQPLPLLGMQRRFGHSGVFSTEQRHLSSGSGRCGTARSNLALSWVTMFSAAAR
jgi:hypothetical protein